MFIVFFEISPPLYIVVLTLVNITIIHNYSTIATTNYGLFIRIRLFTKIFCNTFIIIFSFIYFCFFNVSICEQLWKGAGGRIVQCTVEAATHNVRPSVRQRWQRKLLDLKLLLGFSRELFSSLFIWLALKSGKCIIFLEFSIA